MFRLVTERLRPLRVRPLLSGHCFFPLSPRLASARSQDRAVSKGVPTIPLRFRGRFCYSEQQLTRHPTGFVRRHTTFVRRGTGVVRRWHQIRTDRHPFLAAPQDRPSRASSRRHTACVDAPEAEARGSGSGFWAGAFEPPLERARRRESVPGSVNSNKAASSSHHRS